MLHAATYAATMRLRLRGSVLDLVDLRSFIAEVLGAPSGFLAVVLMTAATIAVPVFGFAFMLRERMAADPVRYLVYVPRRIYLGALFVVWGTVVSTQVLSLIAFIRILPGYAFAPAWIDDVLKVDPGLAIVPATAIAIAHTWLALRIALVWHRQRGRAEAWP